MGSRPLATAREASALVVPDASGDESPVDTFSQKLGRHVQDLRRVGEGKGGVLNRWHGAVLLSGTGQDKVSYARTYAASPLVSLHNT